MGDDLTTIEGVIALPVPLRSMLERVLGYTDRAPGTPARLTGIFWERAGDEARCADGKRTADVNRYASHAALGGLVAPRRLLLR